MSVVEGSTDLAGTRTAWTQSGKPQAIEGLVPDLIQGVMPLAKLPERDLRDACRARLEMLELWLRRLIHEQFEQMYSNDILNAKNAAGDFVLKKELRERIEKHLRDRPGRYNRPIDAALLDDLIIIICKPDTYTSCFATALAVAFPLGNEGPELPESSPHAAKSSLPWQPDLHQASGAGDLLQQRRCLCTEGLLRNDRKS
jgi:hypothetical protein